MSTLEEAGWWIVLVVGLVGTAMYAGLETGLYFLNRVKLEVRASRGPRKASARILRRELERPGRVLATILVGTIAFGDLAATGASQLLAGWGYSELAAIAVNVLVLTPVLFVFAETIPKELFRLDADGLTYALARVLSWSRRAVTAIGVLPLVHIVATGASRMIGGEGEAGLAISARERVTTMLKESAASGALSESQAGLVDRALAFQRMMAAEVMTPWAQVRSIPSDWAREQVVRLVSRERLAFVPVVDRGSAGSVVGVLRMEDAFLRAGGTAAALAGRVVRVPARMTLAETAGRLREAGVEAGIVEEGGRPVGLVALRDVLEPLLGV